MSSEYIQLKPKKTSLKQMFNRKKQKMLIFRHGHIAITDYELGDKPDFEKSLSVFNEMNWTYERKVGIYIPEIREFRIPRGYDIHQLASHFRGYPVMVDNDAYYADKIDSMLLVPPRDDLQRVALSFLCSQGEFKNNTIYTTLMLDQNVGTGKTYTGIAASCFMQARVVIISPMKKLIDQWRDSVLDFTNIQEHEILEVSGSKMCKKILNGEYEHIKIFIFSVDTIVSFADTYGYMKTMDMMESTHAYLKIIDEIHKDLKAVSLIEGVCNFRMNFYMSATPMRTQKKERWIFKNCYKNVPRFGGKFMTEDEKHINVAVKFYSWQPSPFQIKRMVQARTKWLNSNSYERELINSNAMQQESFKHSIVSMLTWAQRLLREGNKILFLTKTIDGTAYAQAVASTIFNPDTVTRYYGSMNDLDKIEALRGTVICATASSMGTGADLKDENGRPVLQFVLTYSNEIDAVQLSGRARKMNDTEVYYVEFVNTSYYKTMKQFDAREEVLKKISKTGKISYYK